MFFFLRNDNSLDFKIYRKPSNNNKFLSFFSSQTRQVKLGLIISLTDRILRICSPKFIGEELLLLKEILLSNHYPGWLIGQNFSKRRKKFQEFSNDDPGNNRKDRCFLFFAICSRAE